MQSQMQSQVICISLEVHCLSSLGLGALSHGICLNLEALSLESTPAYN